MSIRAIQLRCENKISPFIDVVQPDLSWLIEAEGRNQIQTAHQIQIASNVSLLESNSPDLWDSGKVSSDEMFHIEYKGASLKSRQQCFWRVKLWDGLDADGKWSDISQWQMALLDNSDWKAEWIGADILTPFLRQNYNVNKDIKKATCYVTALGLYQLHINGKKVGDQVLAPGWMDFKKRIYYNCFDVTDYIVKGRNAIGVILAPGWQCGHIGCDVRINYHSVEPLLKCQLEMEFVDGSKATIITDGSWGWNYGPVRMADILHGEEYDARLELQNWCDIDFDIESWNHVSIFKKIDVPLYVHPGDPVRKTQELISIDMKQPHPGTYVFDLGQNIVGWIRLKIKDATRGRRIIIRYGEMLNSDGTVYTANLRHAQATDIYYCKGEKEESWEAKFTFHGFRYVQIQGYPSVLVDPTINEPDLGTVTGVVVNSDIERVGYFECSDQKVNQLFSNICWGQRGNFIEIPTDCPQRDERLGWTGDAQVFIRTASYLTDIQSFFSKWLIDLEDAQQEDGAITDIAPYIYPFGKGNNGWGDAAVICPWVYYQVYNSKKILKKHWNMITRWIGYLEKHNDGFIRPASGWGDWLSVEAETPKDLLGTAYFAYSTLLAGKIAEVLQKSEYVEKYKKLFSDIKKAYIKKFVREDGNVYGDTQTAYLLSLHIGLLPDDKIKFAEQYLVNDIERRGFRLTTGFLGISFLNPTLTNIGQSDVAYKLLFQEQFPSWLYEVNQGATTIWERWDSWTKDKGFQSTSMNSFNHYSFGSVGQWLMATVAGIDNETPGFRRIKLCPHPDKKLKYVKASYRSISGNIRSHWYYDRSDIWHWDIEIPANTVASVYVPCGLKDEILESKEDFCKHNYIERIGRNEQCLHLKLGSGRYHFAVHSVAAKFLKDKIKAVGLNKPAEYLRTYECEKI